MTIQQHPGSDQSSESVELSADSGGSSGAGTSSFLQMFLEARPPRDEGR
ncbi:MAG: hypothetical protein WBQ44_21110 [Rhodococcus sp. (in: high G+C Gram-positive bacteria)]